MDISVVGAEGVQAAIEQWARNLFQNRIRMASTEIAHVLEQYAINNHPWQIDTGMTNETTKGRIQEFTDELVTITLSAGMPYDVDLELYRDGRWTWLWPAVLANVDVILDILRKHLSGGGAAFGTSYPQLSEE